MKNPDSHYAKGTLSLILVLVACGLALAAPGIAIFFAILLTPIAVAMWSSRVPDAGAVSGARTIAAIVGIAISAAVAGIVAFFAVCLGDFVAAGVAADALHVSGGTEVGLVIAFIAGPLAGIGVAIVVLRQLRRPPH